jgi:hypothetical protein
LWSAERKQPPETVPLRKFLRPWPPETEPGMRAKPAARLAAVSTNTPSLGGGSSHRYVAFQSDATLPGMTGLVGSCHAVPRVPGAG